MRRALSIAVLAMGCTRRDPAPATLAPLPASESPPPDAAPENPPAIAPVPIAISPALPAREPGMEDHLSPLGWSADSRWFGGCVSLPNGTECELRGKSGFDRFGDTDPKLPEADPKKTKAMKAKLAGLALVTAEGKWPYPDLVVVWKVTEGDQGSTPPRSGFLEVGVRVVGEPIAWFAKLSEHKSPHYDRIHPELVAVSPDGGSFGVIGHAFAGEWANGFPSVVLDTKEVAAKAYRAAAAEHAKKGDAAGAERFEAKARTTSP